MPNKLPAASGAAIFGCAGLSLSRREQALFRRVDPVGFILFKRNISEPEQVKALVREMQSCTRSGASLILIDQEGGRVARLGPPHWRKSPPAGKVASVNPANAARAMWLHYRLIAAELHDLGVNVDCAPMLDVPAPGCDAIIGDRAFGDTPEQVALLGREACRGLLAGGVLPVIKHIPGHGRAKVDSHKALPMVSASCKALEAVDFSPFCALSAMPLAMTAHITYTAIDKEHCATLSPKVVRVIRETIGFNGLLMTDDLSMHALSGDFAERTRVSLAAGCDVVLHCNGDFAEMEAVADALPAFSAEGQARLARALKLLKKPVKFDVAAGLREFEGLVG